MKVAVMTSRERYERFSDPAQMPQGTESIFLGMSYTADDVRKKCSEAEYAIVDAVGELTAEMIDAMPKLKMIHSEGVGYNRIDTAAAAARGIPVCNNRGVNAGPVAEQAVMLMLCCLRRFLEGDRLVREGRQGETKSRFIMEGLNDLSRRHVGIVGLGAIGAELAKRLRPFGCRVSYTSRRRAPAERERELGVDYMTQEQLFAECDIISLNCPVTPETEGMIDLSALRRMKPETILINTARGALVRDADLAEAIRSGIIYGAGLDTLDPEPVPADDPLLLLPAPWNERVALSPHIGGTTLSVFRDSYVNIWDAINAAESGARPANIVNGL
ncbi:MAG: NAD(P)-binding domain-containing protein [Oscillospiraceae bacterium]|nr:NAD(P)-binding domain-containing protein [Oscillospiraceae bacterium]